MDATFGYVFPAIRGVQARREYFVSMCPLRLIPRIFSFDEEEVPAEVRAQRSLNRARIPEMARYILGAPDTYVFSALTASIDGDVEFSPLGNGEADSKIGTLRIPMDARFIINDGQHRRAAIEAALHENPGLGDETIAVVFFIDLGLERCQQMFADLNRYAIRAARSLGVLYDHRDALAEVTRRVAFQSEFFKSVVELERSTLSVRSRKLFTLSALYGATSELLDGTELAEDETARLRAVQTAIDFWDEIRNQMPEWQLVYDGKMSAGEVRRDFIHSHGVVLQALGGLGNYLLSKHKSAWRKRIVPLGKLNWRRGNRKLWEGRAMVGGRVAKGSNNVTLTRIAIKKHLKLPLTAEERRVEEAFTGGRDV